MGRAIDAQRAAGRLAQRGLGGCTDAAGRLPCGSVALTALAAGAQDAGRLRMQASRAPAWGAARGHHVAGAPEAIAGLGPPAAGDGFGGRGPAGGGHVGATPGTGSDLHRLGVVRTGGEPARLVLAPQPRPARRVAGHARGQCGFLRGDAAAWTVAAQPRPAHAAGPGRGHCRDAGVLPRTGLPCALAQGPQQLRGAVRSALAADRGLRDRRTAGH